MRATTAFLFSAICIAIWPVTQADAATRAGVTRAAQPTDFSAQERRRPRVRIYRQRDNRGVYPSYFPGSNAVRDCNVNYVREFRPSGTVIVPNMKCFWRQP